jgi:Tfp pilus assembly protein PilP
MRRVALLSVTLLFVACVKSENSTPDTTAAMAPAAAPAPAPAPAPMSLASVAGKYHAEGKNDKGATVVSYDLDASDTTNWIIQFTDRKEPVKMNSIMASGDSIVVEAGPYASAVQKGAMVTTHTVYHVQDGKLIGRTVAHYNKGPDSVMVITSELVKK